MVVVLGYCGGRAREIQSHIGTDITCWILGRNPDLKVGLVGYSFLAGYLFDFWVCIDFDINGDGYCYT